MEDIHQCAPYSYRRVSKRLLLEYLDIWNIFASQQYKAWLEGRKWKLIAYAAPQCGKSTLAAAVARDLQSRFSTGRSAVVTVFVNCASDEGFRIPDVETGLSPGRLLLLAVLRQLWDADTSLTRSQIVGRSVRTESPEPLRQLVSRSLSHFDRVSLVVDAADQASQEDFVSIETTLSWLIGQGVGVFATRSFRALPVVRKKCDLCKQRGFLLYWRCRHCVDEPFDVCYRCYGKGRHNIHCSALGHTMHEEYDEVEIELRPTGHGLATYIETRFQNMLTRRSVRNTLSNSEDALANLKERVHSVANGLLVIAKSYIDHFMDHRDIDELIYPQREILSAEADFFDLLIDRLRGHGGTDWELAQKVLPIEAQAGRLARGLNFDELRDSLILLEDRVLDLASTSRREELLRACRGLLCLASPPQESLELFHTDFAAHVCEKNYALSTSDPIRMVDLCLRALQLLPTAEPPFPRIAQVLEQLIASRPFLTYAAHFWGRFAGNDQAGENTLKTLQNRHALAACCWIAYSTCISDLRTFDVPPGSTLLHVCAHFGLARLTTFTAQYLNERDKTYGRTPLIVAARHGHDSIVRLLLKLGADQRVQCSLHRTALYEAVARRRVDVIDILLKHLRPREIQFSAERSASPLVLAIRRGNRKLAHELAVHPGIDVSSHDTTGLTPLMAAIQGNQRSVIKSLLERNDLQLHVRNELGQTAAHFAADAADLEYLELILTRCSQAKVLDIFDAARTVDSGYSPCMVLLSNQTASDALSLTFLQRVAAILRLQQQTDYKGRGLLHFAVEGGKSCCIEYLCRQGCHVNLQDRSGWTPLHVACCQGEKTTIEQLLRLGASAVLPDNYGYRPVDVLELYGVKVESGVEAAFLQHNAPTAVAIEPPLWSTVKARRFSRTSLRLRTAEQDPYYGQTALHWAAQEDDPHVFCSMLDIVPLDILNFRAQTVLHIAVSRNKMDQITQLLEKGAKVDIPPGRNSALGLARQRRNNAASLLLLEHSREPLEAGSDLNELLFAAVEERKMAVVKKLLQAGAKILWHNEKGQLVTQVAKDAGMGSEELEFLKREQAAELARIWPSEAAGKHGP